MTSCLAGNEAGIEEMDACTGFCNVSGSTSFGWEDFGDEASRFAARDGSERMCDMVELDREVVFGTTVLLDENDADDKDEDAVEETKPEEFKEAEEGARRAVGFERTMGVFPAVTGALCEDEWSCNGGAAKASIVATILSLSFATAVVSQSKG